MKKLFFGLAALLLAGLTSCSSDDVVVDQNKVLDKDQSFFANIAICSTDAITRADYNNQNDPEFDKGTSAENDINSIFLIFYDADGNRVSTTQVRKENNNLVDDKTKYPDGTYQESGDIIYHGVVQIDVKHGSQIPAYVMCFINPITSTNFEINEDFSTLANLKQTTRPAIINGHGQFAMSKSVYWGRDIVADKDNQLIVATPLKSKDGGYATSDNSYQLFPTYEEAAKATGNSVVDIYVERYAAKVALTVNQSNPIIDLNNGYQLVFTPEYWAVNAYESETYICKSFLSTQKDESNNFIELTYEDLVKALKGTSTKVWKWNNPEYHRCYWAQSPAYYAEDYPRVADDLENKEYILGYYSYEDMKKNADGTLAAKARNLTEDTEKSMAIYVRENTVSGSALAAAAADPSASPKAAIASAVIVGSYKLKKISQAGTDDSPATYGDITTDMFYVMGNATNGYTVFENTDNMRDYFVRTTIKFVDNANNAFFDYDNGMYSTNTNITEALYKKYFIVKHPDANARDGLVIDSRFVTIQLDKNHITEIEEKGLYAYMDNKYVQVTSANIDEVNKQMLYAAGTTQGYYGGKAFYNIPIKHLGFYRDNNANANKMGTESTFDWTKCQSGDFGLVRNHSYSIVVSKIEGLGNGIPEPDVPIVPPTDPEDYYIGARIIVLNWAVVPEQKVTL